MKSLRLAAAAAALMAGCALSAQTAPEDMGNAAGNGKRVRITLENFTTGQVLSPPVFFSHNMSAPPLFMEGKKASFGLMRIAEEGNTGPLLSGKVTKSFGGAYGSSINGISVQPGMVRSMELEVTQEHPLISGAAMLVMTNDGFVGISGINAYALTQPMSMDLLAWDAGTENNTEKGEDLVAMEGPGRDEQNGVVARHTGIRGDRDAPGAWKFDPARPVARVTITPLR